LVDVEAGLSPCPSSSYIDDFLITLLYYTNVTVVLSRLCYLQIRSQCQVDAPVLGGGRLRVPDPDQQGRGDSLSLVCVSTLEDIAPRRWGMRRPGTWGGRPAASLGGFSAGYLGPCCGLQRTYTDLVKGVVRSHTYMQLYNRGPCPLSAGGRDGGAGSRTHADRVAELVASFHGLRMFVSLDLQKLLFST
jgi:hypothetical protein